MRYFPTLIILCVSNRSISTLSSAFTGFETQNRYSITDVMGKPVFYVAEDSGICSRLCLGSVRPCEFSVYDLNRREILRMTRPFRCTSCCCPCFLQVAFDGHTIVVPTGFWKLRSLRSSLVVASYSLMDQSMLLYTHTYRTSDNYWTHFLYMDRSHQTENKIPLAFRKASHKILSSSFKKIDEKLCAIREDIDK